MYSIIQEIINWAWNTGTGYNTTEQSIIYYICGALILLLTVVFVDLIYRVFAHFWNGKT